MGYPTAAPTLLLGLIMAQPAFAEVIESQGTFPSQGKAIRFEDFEPAASGKYPAVVILHGASGMEVGGREFRDFARELARRGYVARIVRYFDQTGTTHADVPTITRLFSTWMLTVGDALTSVTARKNVDPGRLGLLGFSLGSYLSLAVAGHDLRVSAVVEYFGGLPDPFTWNLKRFPPTLILHGEADTVVPVAEARKLERLFHRKGFPFEIRLYPGQGHRFEGDDEKDAYRRALAFLEKHVKKEPTG